MVKRVNAPEEEPEESSFELPSQKEHLMTVTDVNEVDGEPDVYTVKLEIIGGDEEGRTLLHRVNIDDSRKGFYYTRLFLKAMGQSYKGSFDINPDHWVGAQAYCSVVHNTGKNGKTYANVSEFNMDKLVTQKQPWDPIITPEKPVKPEDIAWES